MAERIPPPSLGTDGTCVAGGQSGEGWTFLWAMGLVTCHYALILVALRPPIALWTGLLFAPLVAGLMVGTLDFGWKQASSVTRASGRRGCWWPAVLIAYFAAYQFVGRVHNRVLERRRERSQSTGSTPSPDSTGGPAPAGVALLGTWTLVAAGGQPPESLSIRLYSVCFAEDGTWRYQAQLIGRFEGLSMEGAGSWRCDHDSLSFTAGDNAGVSHVVLDAGRLRLEPDPVLRREGTEPVVGVYER